ncbi:AraC family transcriptional regulator [Paenibacillus sp. ACRRX]|uniref:AraC family transcriptional regulator n=1 Tax=Paenibacillus sp. ACRRX TaxID=2918206 RepID=UPI001EF44C9E|nr:AraC family transcriptional regulator [Paenibacillus sp. ACRRX]MCG7406499.1 AraC family transcriptional regulator [Paenibacillus sp. ACRRX]
MRISDQLVLWNHASITILDIRCISMNINEGLHSYRLPASGFLYAVRGSAELELDGIKHQVNRFHIMHGGKGCRVDIYPIGESFDYYIIYYKALIPLPMRNDIAVLMDRNNPFQLQYGFAPQYPASLLSKVKEMHQAWEDQGSLERFHVKSLFYQFVYELVWQLQNNQIPTIKADVVAQACHYLQQHYAETITLELLAELLDCSPRHLSRLFKRDVGTSPIDYVIQIRMNKAKELLLMTDANLQEIAESVGYPESYYFAKMFKKYVGTAPIRYRSEQRGKTRRLHMTSGMSRYGIVEKRVSPYIDVNNHSQLKGETNVLMYSSGKSSIAIMLLLCLTLLLSACSTGTTGGAANGGTQNQTNQAPSTASTGQEGSSSTSSKQAVGTQAKTKIVSTVKGDVEIPVNPKRVVVLYLLGDVLALGIEPVGISDVYEGAAFESKLAGIQKLGEWFKPSPEAVLALDPDLIIVPSEETYATLNQIAPTVYIPYEEMKLDDRLKQLGEVLGKGEEFQELLNNFYAKVEQSKEKLKQAGIYDKTVSIMEGGKGNMGVISAKNYGRGSQVIYEYLGMKAPSVLQSKIESERKEGTLETVSFEVLHKYAGDYIFRSAYDGMVDLSENKIWNSIPAVKEGRLIDISFGLSYYNDIYSLDKQLDFIVDSLLATVK